MKEAGDPSQMIGFTLSAAARDHIPLADCCKDPNHVIVGDAVKSSPSP